MAMQYSVEWAGLGATPIVKASATRGALARMRTVKGTVFLATQLIGDTILFGIAPPSMQYAFSVLVSSVSLGASTLAIGGGTFSGIGSAAIISAGTPAKYRAAATFTAVDTPTMFALTANVAAAPLIYDEAIYGTIAAANFPASGTLVLLHVVTNG